MSEISRVLLGVNIDHVARYAVPGPGPGSH